MKVLIPGSGYEIPKGTDSPLLLHFQETLPDGTSVDGVNPNDIIEALIDHVEHLTPPVDGQQLLNYEKAIQHLKTSQAYVKEITGVK